MQFVETHKESATGRPAMKLDADHYAVMHPEDYDTNPRLNRGRCSLVCGTPDGDDSETSATFDSWEALVADWQRNYSPNAKLSDCRRKRKLERERRVRIAATH